MANYIISYDLNGPFPSHAEMDKHIRASGATRIGRVLETVWYLQTPSSTQEVYNYVNSILSANDRVLITQADNIIMRNLLTNQGQIKEAWPQAA